MPAVPDPSVPPVRMAVMVELELASVSVSSLSNSWESPTERVIVASSFTASVSSTATGASLIPFTVIVMVAISVALPSDTV